MNIIHFQFPGIPRVHCAFQGRSPQAPAEGDISFRTGRPPEDTLAARKMLAESLRPFGLLKTCELYQVHGVSLLAAPAGRRLDAAYEDLPEADGAMTDKAGLGLMIKTADCQPILLASRSGKHIMALHAGWRGQRAGLIPSAMEKFTRFHNIGPADVFAVRGPSLGPAASEFTGFDSEWGPEFEKWLDRASMRVNLWGLTSHQLAAAGIPRENIFSLDICTHSNPDHYFSYRRDKKSGRQASLIWIAGQ